MITNNKNRILFFSGSNSTNSINQKLVETLARMTQAKTVRSINLRDFPVPLYSDIEEARGIPAETNHLQGIIDDHDLLVIAVPEHNHSVPAFFKNTVDWLSRGRPDYRVLQGKSIILLSACPGNGGSNTVSAARTVLETLGANVIGSLVLNEFDKQTINENEQFRMTNDSFLSEFENLITAA